MGFFLVTIGCLFIDKDEINRLLDDDETTTTTEECDTTTSTYSCTDADGDGIGSADPIACGYYAQCDVPSGYVASNTDCDDASSSVNPAATELCDEVDNDCNGETDEDSASDASTWYADSDDDGYGDADSSATSCEAPTGYVSDATDCDDTDAAYNPGAIEACDDPNDYNCDGSVEYEDNDTDGYVACEDCDDTKSDANPGEVEVCDELDNDCDGTVDEPDAPDAGTWYADTDGDGYGDNSVVEISCSQPSGYVADSGDCDVSDASINPDAVEVCDGADNDCSGTADDGGACVDNDGDGVTEATDCDDSDANVNPDAEESCNGTDDDCDGTVDEDLVEYTYYTDADGDGYGDDATAATGCEVSSGSVEIGGDCDDSDTAYNPGADESDCGDSNDYNCDGSTGMDDLDADGYGTCEECDDSDANVNPDAEESCNGTDDDCDGDTDEEDAVDASTWYSDYDGDGYGDVSSITAACTKPAGYTTDASDCDDRDADVNPGEDEECDGGTDENCDGSVDEDSAVDAPTWYRDSDNDGRGDPAVTDVECEQPTGYVASDDDCDDYDNDAYPGNVEWCDGVDNDCSGVADDGDYDADGFAVCDECDDEDPNLNPGEDEVCDGEDNNCDGDVDENSAVDAGTWYADSDSDGYGDVTVTDVDCNQPEGYVDNATDCDDDLPEVSPDGAEISLSSSSVLTDNCSDGVDDDCDGDVDSADWDCDDEDGDNNENGFDLVYVIDADSDGTNEGVFLVRDLSSFGDDTESLFYQGDSYGGYTSLDSSRSDSLTSRTVGSETVYGWFRDITGEAAGFSSPFRWVEATSSTAACSTWEILDVSAYCQGGNLGYIALDPACWREGGSSGGACPATIGWELIVEK